MDRHAYPPGVWLVTLFDLVLGGLLIWLLIASRSAATPAPPPGPLQLFAWFTDGLMWVTAGSMVAAGVCLLIPRARLPAVILQRGVFWCWVLIVGVTVLTLMLPREGGLGGILLLFGLLVYTGWTLLALHCFRYVRELTAATIQASRANSASNDST